MHLTNKHKLPKTFVEAVALSTRDISKNESNTIGITTLINPPRIYQLTIRHWNEIEEDVSDSLWRILGNSVHFVFRGIDDTNRFIEEKVKEPVLGMVVKGRPDIYDAKEETIIDYKVTSVWAVKVEKIEWVHQINSYCWFFRKIGFPVKKAYVHAILRDWRRNEINRYKDYPACPFKEIEIPLWSFEQQEIYIKQRINLHKEAEKLEDDKIPICSEIERWKNDRRCKEYCLVKKFCIYWRENYGNSPENF